MRMKLRTKIPVHNNKTYCFDFCLKYISACCLVGPRIGNFRGDLYSVFSSSDVFDPGRLFESGEHLNAGGSFLLSTPMASRNRGLVGILWFLDSLVNCRRSKEEWWRLRGFKEDFPNRSIVVACRFRRLVGPAISKAKDILLTQT